MQTKEGKVLSLVRPVYSPWMWEVWSGDNGQSWGPATTGPFACYACYACCALATESGALLVSGRMPGLGLYASFDSGMTWKPYRVDTAGLWAMGTMYEVEPNLVFYVLHGPLRKQHAGAVPANSRRQGRTGDTVGAGRCQELGAVDSRVVAPSSTPGPGASAVSTPGTPATRRPVQILRRTRGNQK